MLKDTNYTAELDALRRSTHDAAPTDTAVSAGAGAEQGEEDGQVSTSEALDMLRQVRAKPLTYIKAASVVKRSCAKVPGVCSPSEGSPDSLQLPCSKAQA